MLPGKMASVYINVYGKYPYFSIVVSQGERGQQVSSSIILYQKEHT